MTDQHPAPGLGVCHTCGRPHQSAESYYAALELLSTVHTVFEDTRATMFQTLASARAALGRIERDWRKWARAKP